MIDHFYVVVIVPREEPFASRAFVSNRIVTRSDGGDVLAAYAAQPTLTLVGPLLAYTSR